MKITDIPLRVYDLEGNWLEDVENLNCFNKKYNLKLKNAYRVAEAKDLFCENYQFRYLNNDTLKSLSSVINKSYRTKIPIGKYWNNKLICVYNSIHEAQQQNNLTSIDLLNSMKYSKEIKGFLFKKI